MLPDRWPRTLAKDLLKDFEGKKADGWGYSESVLIDGDKVVCTPGGPTNTMVALDKTTGQTRWTTSRPEDRGAGHSSIVVSTVGGTRIYVQDTGSGAMGVRAEDGKLLWTFDIDQTTAVIPTPIVRDNLVFFVAGYGRGGAFLKRVPQAVCRRGIGRGRLSAQARSSATSMAAWCWWAIICTAIRKIAASHGAQ